METKRSTTVFRMGDLLIIALIATIALLSAFHISSVSGGKVATTATVEVNGTERFSVSLRGQTAPRSFSIEGVNGESVMETGPEGVRMVKSQCRDKLCVGVGWVSTPGRDIVCLPNRVVIKIRGTGDNAVDTVTE